MTDEDRKPIRFLFAMFQGGGNIPLIMPIVSRLVASGHEVRVIAGPGIRPAQIPISESFLQRIVAAGATYCPFRKPEANPFDSAPPIRGLLFGWLPHRLVGLATAQARTTVWSSSWAKNVSLQLRENGADVVVADYWLLGALAAAEAANLPSAALVHNAFPPNASGQPPKGLGFLPARTLPERFRQLLWQWAWNRVWVRNGLPFHNTARSELGLKPLRHPFQQYDRATRVLVLGSKTFDFAAPHLAANVCYVGTPIDDTPGPTDRWASPWPQDDARALVLVSLSTLSQGQGPVMHHVLEAIATMPVRALVTLGPSLRKDDFAAAPNIVFEPFVPHSTVLPHVSAMVTQCGLGTLTKALMHGVPLVCIPLVGDQPDNAARIVAHGAGVRLSGEASAAEIQVALRRVLAEPHFRQAAQFLATKLSAERPEDAAVAQLESLVR